MFIFLVFIFKINIYCIYIRKTMTDKYEFERSCQPQGVEQETPYQNKTTQWVNDINGGNYQSNGLSLIQFDLSSIFNGNNMVDPKSAYLAIPITYASAYVTAAALVAPTVSLSWGGYRP
jgi:hypothetical protein